MSEVRTTSSTGGQKGVKPQRHDLLPKQALDMIAEVYAFGAEKYADHNWRKGYEWGKSYAALQRHLTAFWDGETYDEESGLNHLGHAGFHIFALLTWLAEQGEGVENLFDDRWLYGLERAKRAAETAEAPTVMLSIPHASVEFIETMTGGAVKARFVAGAYGTEDTDDSMSVSFSTSVQESLDRD